MQAQRMDMHMPTDMHMPMPTDMHMAHAQVNEALMAASGKESTIFLHCLPAERGRETTDAVLESSASHVFQSLIMLLMFAPLPKLFFAPTWAHFMASRRARR